MPIDTSQSLVPDYSRELDIESLISAPLVAISKANAVMAQGQTRFLLEYCFNQEDTHYTPVMIRMALIRSVITPEKEAEPGVPPVPASPPGVTPVIAADPGKPAVPAKPPTLDTETTFFDIPLLTLVPFNSLIVDKMNVGFHIEITSAIPAPNETANQSSNLITDQKAQLNGKISNSEDNLNRNVSKPANRMKVNIDAAQLPLPKGILTIIDLYSKNILPATPANS